MPFRPCPSGCGRFLSADDGHDRCLQCLGFQHAEDAFVDDSCACCGRMSMILLRSRLSFIKGLAPSAATRAGLSGSSRGPPADALGDLRVTVRASPPGTSPRTSYSSRSESPVRFPGDFAGPSHGAPSISFGAPSVDRMSIAASGDGFTSSEDEGAVGLPPSGVVATAAPDPELMAMLARAAVSIGLEVNRPPSPEPSRLDNWFLGAGCGSQPRSTPVPFFPEVHEELTKSWMAPFTARSRSSASSILTTLNGGVARGYTGIPQVERAIAHLCPRNAATWRNRPRLPSKACKLTAALAAKAYSAAGQAASALHAMARVVPTRGWCRSCARRLTSFYERRKSRRGPSGRRCPPWWSRSLNLAEMKDTDKARFLDAPISQEGLFGDTVEGFAQQFSAVQQQTEAIQHILPRRDAPSTATPGARPQSARRRGRPPASSRAAPPQAESTHRLARRAFHRRAAPPASQPGPKSSRKSTKQPWRGQPGDVGVCSFSGDGENSAAPSPGGGPGGESSVSFCFCSATFSKKEQFPFPPGSQVHGMTVCDALPPHSRPRPILPVAKRVRFGLWPVRFGTQGVRWGCIRTHRLLCHPPLLPFAAPPQVRRLCHWSRLHSIWRRGSCCSACLAGSRAQFDSATRFSSPGDLPSSTPFSRRRWQSGMPLSCVRRLLSSWQRMQSSRSLQPRWGRGFTALTSSYPRKVVAFGQSWICESWTGLCTMLPFKMLTHRRMIKYIQPLDWFAAIDLKDAYFHVSILPRHRPFLGRLLGHMASAAAVTPLGLLHMRPLQHWLHSRVPRWAWRRGTLRVGISQQCRHSLSPWTDLAFLRAGLPLEQVSRHTVVTTDASSTGWGATCNGQAASGSGLGPDCFGTSTVWSVSYINRLGGIQSHRMSELTRHLLLWSHTQFKSLRAVHIPGQLNRAADALSRQLTFPGEWRLHPETIRLIWSQFGEAQVDLFASPESSHCQLYFSLTEGPLGTDALAHSWPRTLRKYAFPPVSLLAQTLCKLREDEEQVLLVAPHWPTRTWFPELISLATAPSEKADPALALLCPVRALRIPHSESQKLWAALCLPRRAAEREGCLQTEVGPLDSGDRRLGVPVARRAVPPGGEGSLHLECCLLPCVGARRLFGRHLQSCGLGDTEHLRKILQSPRRSSFFPCVG